MTAGGTYTLLVELGEEATIDVGALGRRTFDPGWYAYVGSAHGPGGFSRIDRHRELASGERDVRHWHVDYLLGHPGVIVDTVVRTSDVDAECAIATAIDGGPVPAFGCSDCDCHSHLFYREHREPLLSSIRAAHRSVRS